MIGVNLAGADFGAGRGVYGTDYIYPNASELDYYREKGIELIRLPFTWERMQPELGGALDAAELGRMTAFLDAAAERGMHVIIDMHNYGRYDGTVIGSGDVSIADFQNVWGQLGAALKGHPAISGFGIMNEPHGFSSASVWPAAAQAAVDAIRDAGATQTIIVSGDGWSGAHSWMQLNADLRMTDPFDNVMYEAHQYFDRGSTGVYGSYDDEGAYPTVGVDRVQPFLDWLSENNLRGFIGEYAVPDDDPRWLPVLDNFLKELDAHGVASAYWAGGPWWGSYRLAIEPRDGADRPQMDVLEHNAQYEGYAALTPDAAADAALNERLYAPAAGAALYGYDGDDVLTGAAASDTLWGGLGNDTLAGGGSRDFLYGGEGKDVLGGQDGDDVLSGGDGDDRLYGDAGDDSLQGGAGSDQLFGGIGHDVLDGGDGDDMLAGGDGNDSLNGGLGNDVLGGETGDDLVAGGAGDDKLFGDAGDDTLGGQDGNDTLSGGIGNDRLYGDAGNDFLEGGEGHDALDGGAGDDQLQGDAGDDTLHGADGADSVLGGSGNDSLHGDGGDDVIDGGSGDDIAYGGTGSDRIAGGDGADQLFGEAGDDIIGGQGDNDLVSGGDGNDRLYGDAGDDILGGGNGNDWIEGGFGDDQLWGDPGADTFAFAEDSGNDEILDFNGALDRLQLNGQHYALRDTPDGVALQLSGGGTVLMLHVAASDFNADWILV